MKFILLFFLLFVSAQAYSQTLLIFGGKDQSVFLGCLNCDKYEDKSIWNKYGDYGSKYEDKSIWNKYGDYGGKYSDYSPFNKYASHPPAIRDNKGNFYGYFTADTYKSNRAKIDLTEFIIDYWESICEDVGGYYEKIFK